MDQTVRWQAEAHTALRRALVVTRAVTASSVAGELAFLEGQQSPLMLGFADSHGFVLGYGGMVQACLVSLMEPLIGWPEAFRYPVDEGLQKWWFFHREGGREAIPLAAESSDGELAGLLATVNGLVNGVRQAGIRWNSLAAVMQAVQEFAESVLSSLPECQVVSVHGAGNLAASSSEIVRHRVADWLAGPVLRGPAVSNAAEFANPGRGGERFVYGFGDEEAALEVLTPHDEDYSPSFAKSRSFVPSYGKGVLAAVAVAVADLLGTRVSDAFPYSLKRDDRTMFECLEARLGAVLWSKEFAESQVLVPNEIVRISAQEASVPVYPIYPPDKRLKVVLGNNRRLVASADEMSPVLIEPILRGLCSGLAPDERANVLWILSTRSDCPYTKVTVALEMRLMLLSDQTTWWCFYGAAGTGTWDPDVVRSENVLKQLLEKYEQCIKITEVGPLDDDQLIKVLSPYGWNELRQAYRYSVDDNAALRAALSEAMAALYIGAQGYDTVRNNLVLKSPRCEIDAAGGSRCDGENRILVAEVKGRSTNDEELRASYRRFCDLVAKLQENSVEITSKLGLPNGLVAIEGIYISLGDAENFDIDETVGVQLWGFERFLKELADTGISRKYRDLLREEHIVRLVTLFDDGDWIKSLTEGDWGNFVNENLQDILDDVNC